MVEVSWILDPFAIYRNLHQRWVKLQRHPNHLKSLFHLNLVYNQGTKIEIFDRPIAYTRDICNFVWNISNIFRGNCLFCSEISTLYLFSASFSAAPIPTSLYFAPFNHNS